MNKFHRKGNSMNKIIISFSSLFMEFPFHRKIHLFLQSRTCSISLRVFFPLHVPRWWSHVHVCFLGYGDRDFLASFRYKIKKDRYKIKVLIIGSFVSLFMETTMIMTCWWPITTRRRCQLRDYVSIFVHIPRSTILVTVKGDVQVDFRRRTIYTGYLFWILFLDCPFVFLIFKTELVFLITTSRYKSLNLSPANSFTKFTFFSRRAVKGVFSL